jgi:tripartite-type tricarboxylate transporter receptor subunit TctC
MYVIAALSSFAPGAQTQEGYPARPVRIVVPQSPGGSIDTGVRIIALKLTEALKQAVVIDNRPGAGTVNGTEIVARAIPDGYTLLAVASSFTINPSLYAKLSYDAARDFTAVAQISKYPYLLMAHPALPAQSLQGVIALAKAKPGFLNYASAGLGTGTHVAMELLRQMAGIDIVHVPYKGGGPAAIAAMGGQVQLLAGTTISNMAHVRAGRLRALAVTSSKRATAAPDVPTFAESGVPATSTKPGTDCLRPRARRRRRDEAQPRGEPGAGERRGEEGLCERRRRNRRRVGRRVRRAHQSGDGEVGTGDQARGDQTPLAAA